MELTAEVLDQAIRYNMVLNVKYMIITNGTLTYVFRREDRRFTAVGTLPRYEEMIK